MCLFKSHLAFPLQPITEFPIVLGTVDTPMTISTQKAEKSIGFTYPPVCRPSEYVVFFKASLSATQVAFMTSLDDTLLHALNE